jgi:hypothetical protein
LAGAEQEALVNNMAAAGRNAEAAEAGLPKGSPDWLRAQDIAMQARSALAHGKKHK